MSSHPKHKKHREEKAAEQKKLQEEEQKIQQESEQQKKQTLQDIEHQQKLQDVEQLKSQQELEHRKKLQDLEAQNYKQELEKQKAKQAQDSEHRQRLQELAQQKQQQDLEHKLKLKELEQQAPQAVSAEIDYDKLTEVMAQKTQGQSQQPAPQAVSAEIDYDKLAEVMAQKMQGQSQQPAPQVVSAEIDYDKLSKMMAQKMQGNSPQASQSDPVAVDYDKIIKSLSDVIQGQPVIQQSTSVGQDKCDIRTQELRDNLKGLEISSYKNDNKTMKDIKDVSKLLYTLYQQLHNMQNSYYTVDDSVEAYDEKADSIRKINNKLYTLLSKTVNDLSMVNIKNAEVADDINNAIKEIKQVAPKEFSNNFNKIYNFLKDTSEKSDLIQDYCNACGSDLENLNENDQLMLFSVCSANMMIGLEAIAAESDF